MLYVKYISIEHITKQISITISSEISFGESMLLECIPFVEILFILVSQILAMCVHLYTRVGEK